ncbi:hypothetical protein MF271_06890 [Deinococcus sp. KNUC1210]|uniref:hypothetical protein n=1 Tax=Deinococcus sp. KNUC1210 TaxID=2917691 RepID=UPI001EF058EB|nr:hypothetical protein [Deinococcus sp. KNUC1210]ULH16322.1 hypothetical protein MF271_06890 [Deinococcus sp. KNUC1210]
MLFTSLRPAEGRFVDAEEVPNPALSKLCLGAAFIAHNHRSVICSGCHFMQTYQKASTLAALSKVDDLGRSLEGL